jgi:hypothetical protein
MRRAGGVGCDTAEAPCTRLGESLRPRCGRAATEKGTPVLGGGDASGGGGPKKSAESDPTGGSVEQGALSARTDCVGEGTEPWRPAKPALMVTIC